MARKTISILLVILSLFIMISSVKGDDGWMGGHVQGSIGKYLYIESIWVHPYDARVNETINVGCHLDVWKDMFINVIEIRFEGVDIVYNKTLVKDKYIEIPPNALAGAVHESFNVTYTKPTPLHCYIHAKYEYNEENKTLEQEGTFEVFTIATVRYSTYSDLWTDNRNLTQQIRTLETSHSSLQEFANFLTFATSVFIVTTCVFIATTFYAKRKRKST